MSAQGIDEDKLRTLGGWAAGLRTDPRAEVAAAGRAIEMLIEEVERLHVLLWDMRLYPRDFAADATPAEGSDAASGGPPAEPAAADPDDSSDQTFRERLAFPWRRAENPQR